MQVCLARSVTWVLLVPVRASFSHAGSALHTQYRVTRFNPSVILDNVQLLHCTAHLAMTITDSVDRLGPFVKGVEGTHAQTSKRWSYSGSRKGASGKAAGTHTNGAGESLVLSVVSRAAFPLDRISTEALCSRQWLRKTLAVNSVSYEGLFLMSCLVVSHNTF